MLLVVSVGKEDLLLLSLQKQAKSRGVPVPFALPAFSRFSTVSLPWLWVKQLKHMPLNFSIKNSFPC
jgi:hypothetical protein